jgi:hypothetical protein
MRNFTLFTLFFLACFSLFGQTSREVKIYVPPIAGYGRDRDNNYFYKQVAYEVIFQYQIVVKSQGESDYIFKGTIEPVSGLPVKEPPVHPLAGETDNYSLIQENAFPPVKDIPGRYEFFSIEDRDEIYFIDSKGGGANSPSLVQEEEEAYYFKLEMIHSGSGEVLDEQSFIFFVTNDSVNKNVSDAVYNLLSGIPDVPVKRGDSRDRWMYFETSVLWMPRMYYGGCEGINLLNLGMKLGMELHFLSFMSLGAGVQVTQDQVVNSGKEFVDLILEAPVSLKLVFKLDDNYALEPYGGAAWNYSLGKTIQPSEYSWFAGVQFGIKDKSETGMFVIDPRFSMDFYDSVLTEGKIKYRRYCIQLGLGYKFGAFQKRSKI